MCAVIACMARHDQVVFAGVGPPSPLAQRGMVRLCLLVFLPVIACTPRQCECGPSLIICKVRHSKIVLNVVEHDYLPPITCFFCISLPWQAFWSASIVSYEIHIDTFWLVDTLVLYDVHKYDLVSSVGTSWSVSVSVVWTHGLDEWYFWRKS